MCYEDAMVIRGRLRARFAAVAAALAVAPGLAACGEDEEGSTQTPAPAETGVAESTTSTTQSGETDGAEAEPDEPAGEPVDDQGEITKTLDGVLAGSDPVAACGELVTDRFLRRSYGDASGCEAALGSAKPATDAGIEEIVVHPDSVAQARAKPRGGIYDDQELRAELVLDGETWKLDSLRSNVPVGP